MPSTKTKTRRDVYQEVTDIVLDALERDVLPWRRTWTSAGLGLGLHRNLVSRRPYRGINVFLLELTAASKGFSSPYWLTFKQAKAKGGQVRKGEKGTLVVFWKPYEYKRENEDTGEQEKVKALILRHYIVFNLEQCDDIAPPVTDAPAEPFDAIEEAERALREMPERPKLRHGGDRAYYSPSDDLIQLPTPQQFDTPEHYYSTSFHEHVHATGHASRLNRKLSSGFGSADYASEELVAEMGQAMLCAMLGLDVDYANTASYVRHWMSADDYAEAIRGDKKLVVQAAARAQKAADWIIGQTPQENGSDHE